MKSTKQRNGVTYMYVSEMRRRREDDWPTYWRSLKMSRD